MAGRGRRMRPVDWLLRNAGGKRGWRRGGSTIDRIPTTLVVSPSSFTVTDTFTAQLNATVLDQFGQAMSGQSLAWASDNTLVATVSQTGLVTGEDVGTCTITAVVVGYPTATDDSACTVQAKTATVEVSPATFAIDVNDQQALVATPRDSGGNALTGRSILWASTDTNVATVAAGSGYNATATGVGAGAVTINATVEGVVGSSTGDVTEVPAGATYPNEPAGLSQIYHHSCDGLPDSGTASIEAVVPGGNWSRSGSSGFSVVTDATAPVNGPQVLRIVWPAGMQDGVGPGAQFDCTFGANYKELYVSYHFKLTGPGGVLDGWEMQGTATKMLGYLSYGLTNRQNQFFMWFNPNTFTVDVEPGPWGTKSDFTAEYGGPDISQNVTATKHIALGWNQMELYFKINSAPGVADGVHRVWVNGTLVIERTNLVVFGASSPTTAGFRQLHFHPIWGGDNGQVKTRDDYLYLSDLYASGIEQ